MRLFLVFYLLVTAGFSYTSWDGKEVSPLPGDPNGFVCSTFVQFYMAMRTQTSGKTIFLKDGTYNISAVEPFRFDSAGVSLRGLSGDPNKVVLVGHGFESCVNEDEELVQIYTHDITIADLTLAESRCHGIKFQGGNNDHTIIHNVRFFNMCELGIKAPGTLDAAACSVRYCHFENNKVPTLDICGIHYEGHYIGGMDLMNARSWVVHDNVFKNIKGLDDIAKAGVFFWQGCSDITVERNTFVNCNRAISYGIGDVNQAVSGGIIRNNFMAFNAPFIGLEITDCSGIKVYNNTMYCTNPAYFRLVQFAGSNGPGNEFKNNIVFGNLNYVSGPFPDTSHNIWKTSSQDRTTDWFFNKDSADLHLSGTATSAIDAGMDLSAFVPDDWDREWGICRSPDIGADERIMVPDNCDAVERQGNANVGRLGVTVNPNPFNAVVTMRVTGVTHRSALQVMVFNLSGKFIADITRLLKDNTLVWDASSCPSGVYLVQVHIGSSTLATRAILLK